MFDQFVDGVVDDVGTFDVLGRGEDIAVVAESRRIEVAVLDGEHLRAFVPDGEPGGLDPRCDAAFAVALFRVVQRLVLPGMQVLVEDGCESAGKVAQRRLGQVAADGPVESPGVLGLGPEGADDRVRSDEDQARLFDSQAGVLRPAATQVRC